MRNQPIALDRTDAAHAYTVRDALTEGKVYRLTYVKRDKTESESTGAVQYFNGREGCDTMSVTLDTTATKGRPSTINLVNVTSIQEV